MSAPRRLYVAGLWMVDALPGSIDLPVCLDRRDPIEPDALWAPLAAMRGEQEGAYRERLRELVKPAGSLWRHLLVRDVVVLTTSRWGWHETLPLDPLVQVFIHALVANGFAPPETLWPRLGTSVCRNVPWCRQVASPDLCLYCLPCFEAAAPLEQRAMARAYNDQQPFNGNCKAFFKAMGIAQLRMNHRLEHEHEREVASKAAKDRTP